MTLSIEPLEPRCVPGGILSTYDPGLVLLMATAYASPGLETAPVGWGRQEISLPNYDLALIGRDNGGKPDNFLDQAHDVLGVGPAADVASVDGVIDAINTTYQQLGHPIDLVLVGVTTSGDSGVVLGSSYLFWASPDTEKLLTETGGHVGSVTIICSNGGQKVQLFQSLADGWTRGNFVEVTGYTGTIFIGTSIFGQQHFYMGPHGNTVTVHSQ